MVNTIIKGCSRIQQKYTEMLIECANLQVKIWNEPTRNDLQLLEKYIRNYPLVFSAAGYLQLNEKLLSSFFSETDAYLIVVIQFSSMNV